MQTLAIKTFFPRIVKTEVWVIATVCVLPTICANTLASPLLAIGVCCSSRARHASLMKTTTFTRCPTRVDLIVQTQAIKTFFPRIAKWEVWAFVTACVLRILSVNTLASPLLAIGVCCSSRARQTFLMQSTTFTRCQQHQRQHHRHLHHRRQHHRRLHHQRWHRFHLILNVLS